MYDGPETVITIAQNALLTVIYISAPLLLVALSSDWRSVCPGDHADTGDDFDFIPKILSVILTVAVLGAWMLNMLTDYTVNLYESILQIIR